jgi:hypothetical protein
LCKDRVENDVVPDGTAIQFSINEPCTDLKTTVTKHELYRLNLRTTKAWYDDRHTADPTTGVAEANLSLMMKAYEPYRRVTSANYLHPVTQVRTHHIKSRFRRLIAPLVGPDIDVRTTRFVDQGNGQYSMAFCPTQAGHLYLFVNDVDVPFSDYFYTNNKGAAKVTVTPLHQACDPDLLRECQEDATKEAAEKDRRCRLAIGVKEAVGSKLK